MTDRLWKAPLFAILVVLGYAYAFAVLGLPFFAVYALFCFMTGQEIPSLVLAPLIGMALFTIISVASDARGTSSLNTPEEQ